MEKITTFIENVIAPPLIKLSMNRYLQAIQGSFIALMPIMIYSSMLILAAALPIPGWNNLVGPFVGKLWGGVGVTLGFLALGISIALGYNLGSYYNDKNPKIRPLTTAILSFLSFMSFSPSFSTEAGISVVNATYFGSTGIFSAIIIAIITVELYRWLFSAKKLVINLPEGVPPAISASFNALIPSSLVLFFWFAISFLFSLNLPSLIMDLFAPLLSAGKAPISSFIAFVTDRTLWTVGIHGSGVVGSVMGPIWTTMIAENMQAFQEGIKIPHAITVEWINAFARISPLPLCILLIRSKVARFRILGRLAILPALFNIIEPVFFGLPIALNPLMLIPFVIGNTLIFALSWIFTTVIPIIKPIIAQVPWTLPGPLQAYLGTGGDIPSTLFCIMNYFILGFMYYPFVKIMEKQEELKSKELE